MTITYDPPHLARPVVNSVGAERRILDITFEPPSFARKVVSPIEVDRTLFEIGVGRALDIYDLHEPREVYERSARLYFDRGWVNERLKSNRIRHREDPMEYAGFDYAMELIMHPTAILRPEDDAPESQ